MPYEVYAQCCRPRYATDAMGRPTNVHPMSHYARVLIGSYSTLRRAQRAAERTTHVYLNDERTLLVTGPHIHVFEIVETP